MKKKLTKLIAIAVMFTSAMTMSACATDDTIPISKEDNKEEYDLITTFAAELLMKYSYNVVDDLTYVAIKNSEKAEGSEEITTVSNAFAGMAIDTGDTEQSTEVATTDTDNLEQIDTNSQESGDDNSSDPNSSTEISEGSGDDITAGSNDGEGSETGTTDGSETTEQDDNQDQNETTQETIVANDDLTDLDSELGGLKLAFNGYSVMNSYPSMNVQGAVTAKDGEKVLVLNFVLSNPTSSEISLNILNRNATFKVSVNGSNVGYTKVTMLTNDLSSYVGSVPAGSEEQLVLLVVIPSSQASSISDIAVTISINGNSYTVKLE